MINRQIISVVMLLAIDEKMLVMIKRYKLIVSIFFRPYLSHSEPKIYAPTAAPARADAWNNPIFKLEELAL